MGRWGVLKEGGFFWGGGGEIRTSVKIDFGYGFV